MVKVTDEDIAKLENAFGIKLLDHQKELIKRLAGAGHIFIPRHNGYGYTLQAIAYASMIVSNKEKEEPNETQRIP